MGWLKRNQAAILFAIFIPLVLAANLFVWNKTLFLLNTDLDSGGYLFHNYFRTIGYQFFLQMTNFSGRLYYTPAIQLNLLLASFLYLAFGVLACFRSLGLAALVLLICCLNATALAESYLLMTECMFMAALCLTFGALLQTLAKPSWIRAGQTGVFFVVAYAVRPAGLFLLLPLARPIHTDDGQSPVTTG